MSDHLSLTADGPVITLTINRPEKRNALSYGMWSEIPRLVSTAAQDPRARVLVVKGTADVFSAGADIGEFRDLRRDAEGARRYQLAIHAATDALTALPLPTVASITGFCIGGGCELALACDLRLASDTARFGITPAKLGIVFSLPSTKLLVDAVGPAWAKQILYTAEIIDAPTALRIGLVNELHSPDALPERTAELAALLASRSAVTIKGAKEIVNRVTEGRAEEDEGVLALYEDSATSRDYAEGVAAFLEKRPPRF